MLLKQGTMTGAGATAASRLNTLPNLLPSDRMNNASTAYRSPGEIQLKN